MTVDPMDITNYYRSDRELELFWLFCIMAAGKNADITASALGRFYNRNYVQSPFEYIQELVNAGNLEIALKMARTGQYKKLQRAFTESLSLDLRTATVDELMEIHGVGPKTSRMFILHSRSDARCAVLDVHILRWLKNFPEFIPVDVPDRTPSNLEKYEELEDYWLILTDVAFPGITKAKVDLMLWIEGSGRLKGDDNEKTD